MKQSVQNWMSFAGISVDKCIIQACTAEYFYISKHKIQEHRINKIGSAIQMWYGTQWLFTEVPCQLTPLPKCNSMNILTKVYLIFFCAPAFKVKYLRDVTLHRKACFVQDSFIRKTSLFLVG